MLAISSENPAWGCVRIADHFQLEGVSLSSPTVQTILIKHGVGTKYERLLRLEERMATQPIELTAEQIRLIEKANPCFKERHVESGRPASCWPRTRSTSAASRVPEITVLTGIDDAMVEGHTIDPEAVARLATPAALIVAHNAAFDRRFAERFCQIFTTKAWACSMSEIDWAAEGFEGVKLGYLVQELGFFYAGHRAIHDCAAAVELLARPLPRSGMTGLQRVLASARAPTWRIYAENSPFEFKDLLKARGYRWNGEENGRPRSWWIDVPSDRCGAEIAFLCREIYQRETALSPQRITAYDRFSDRC